MARRKLKMTKKCIAARRRYKKNKRKRGAGFAFMKLSKTPGTEEYALSHILK